MLTESDGSTGSVGIGETPLAYRGRRAGRAYKGFPGTWEIPSFPFVTVPGTGNRMTKPRASGAPHGAPRGSE
jgi:hypothetical protein